MKTTNDEKGFVLVVCLMIMAVLTIIGIAATTNTSLELKIAGNDRLHKETFYKAEAADILSVEILEQNINCAIGFGKTSTVGGVDVADIEGNIRVYSRPSPRSELALYLNPEPWTTTNCNITYGDDVPDISFPLNNGVVEVERADVYLGGHAAMLPGGSLQMAAGYERKGKSAAGGGTARLYDIIARQRGALNSEAVVIFGWRHLIGEESTCVY